jgi:hypothetical protein
MITEDLARAIHEDYVRRARDEGKGPTGPSVVVWDRLPETLKRSNRDQAADIEAKLAAIGCSVEPAGGRPEPVTELSPDEVELLARMEHDRWLRERRADGWTLAETKDVERKTTPYLVPWEELPEGVRDFDRDAVRAIPRLVARAGLRIVRAAERSRPGR